MRKVKLQGTAPGVDNFAFIVEVTAADGQDQNLLVGLTQQRLNDLLVVAYGIGPNKFLVLLDAKDEVIAVGVELGDLFVGFLQCPTFSHPQDTTNSYRNQCDGNK